MTSKVKVAQIMALVKKYGAYKRLEVFDEQLENELAEIEAHLRVVAPPVPEPTMPVDATTEEWRKAVLRAYVVLRHKDNTIPSDWLDFMREKLLAASPTQPRPKPLSDEAIQKLWAAHERTAWNTVLINPVVFARAIEAAHGITPAQELTE